MCVSIYTPSSSHPFTAVCSNRHRPNVCAHHLYLYPIIVHFLSDINNVGSMSQVLYLASTLADHHTEKPYDPAEAARWQASQVSAISLTNFAGRIVIGRSSFPPFLSILYITHPTSPRPPPSRVDIRPPQTHLLPSALRQLHPRLSALPLLPNRRSLHIPHLALLRGEPDAGVCAREHVLVGPDGVYRVVWVA